MMAEEVSPEIISSTQKTLGKYVTRPPLSEKFLKKPPFRFLHDVINAVIRETGFLKGLFSEGELLSDNVKDRDGKIAFLNKLITAVKTISGTDLAVRASKIIAGLEPVETNKLLQAIGTSIDQKLDSKEYVNSLKTKSKSKTKDADKPKKVASKGSVKSEKSNDSTRIKKSPAETPKAAKPTKTKEVPKRAQKTDLKSKSSKDAIKGEKKSTKAKDSPSLPAVTPKDSPRDKKLSPRATASAISEKIVPKASEEVPELVQESVVSESIQEVKFNDIITEESTNVEEEPKIAPTLEEEKNVVQRGPSAAERPKSARPRSGDDIKKAVSELRFEANPVKPEKKIQQPPIMRPKSSLRPPSVRPSSARPGAPRLRPDSALPMKEMIPLGKINVIIENFGDGDGKEEDEEETVVIQNLIEDVPEPMSLEKSLDVPADKGHLVEQILEQIQAPEQIIEEQSKGRNNWEQENSRGKDATAKEINQLRASIQSLTRTANPLGKLMSYLHEDVEAMHSELDSWTNIKRQFTSEINKQKRVNEESNQPLINQLQDLEDSIKKQREEIATVKFNILKNEERIKDLVTKQVTVQ